MALLSALFVLAGCNTRTLSGRVWKLESTPNSFSGALEFRDRSTLRSYNSEIQFADLKIRFVSPTEFDLLKDPSYTAEQYGRYEVTFEARDKIKVKSPDGSEQFYVN